MKLEFHDQAPKRNLGGRRLDPLLVEFLAALKANPGKWAQYPKPVSPNYRTRLAQSGFAAAMRNVNPSTKRGDLWASWPGKATAVAVKSRPPVNGKVVRCDDCGWQTGTDHLADLDRHTRAEHKRPVLRSEKMPVEVAA